MSNSSNESQYAKAKKDSLIVAFTLSIIISICLSYVVIDIWWGKLLFEVGSKLFIFFVSWKVISELTLKIQIKIWKKKHSNEVLEGNWYVVHFSDDERYRDYLRFGTAEIKQNMDEYNISGQNYSIDETQPDINVKVSSWCGASPYRLQERVFAGEFDVQSHDRIRSSDGLHSLTAENGFQVMRGVFFNVNCNEQTKPRTGKIEMYRDEHRAKSRYQQLTNREKGE